MTSRTTNDFPADFNRCIDFHGHLCPGLAIGYAAVKAGRTVLPVSSAEDEEIVAIVENDSCAADAVQVLLGCTFGKGNFIFRDWGKHVYTFMDRKRDRAVRVAMKPKEQEDDPERVALKKRLDAGQATPEDRARWEDMRRQAASDIINAPSHELFDIREIPAEPVPYARIIETRICDRCGEEAMVERLVEQDGVTVCRGCLESGE